MSGTDEQHLNSGWITFSAAMLTLGGLGNLIWGLHALDHRQSFYEGGVIWTTLGNWGWIAVLWGALVLIGATLLWLRRDAGVVLGVLLAIVSAAFWLLLLPALPIFSLIAIVIDLLVIYGLTAHGLKQIT
jgi:hypothetical protein